MRKKEILKFFIRLNIFLIPFYIIIILNIQLNVLIDITKNLVLGLMNITGIKYTLLDSIISIPIKDGSWGAQITWDCVGWKSMFLFFALVMATKTNKDKKIKGLLLIPVIYIINIARIWFMFFFVSSFDLAYFSIVHAVIWSFGLVIVVLGLWYFWLSKLNIRDKAIL